MSNARSRPEMPKIRCPKGYHGVNVTATQAAICHGCPRGTFGDAKALKDISECKCAPWSDIHTRFPHLTIFPQPCRGGMPNGAVEADEGPPMQERMQVIIDIYRFDE